MLKHQHERLLGITVILEPIKSLLTDDVSGVANVVTLVGFRFNTTIKHWRVVVWSLANKNVEIVVSLRSGFQVPLTNHGSLVARCIKKFRESLLIPIEGVSVPDKTVEVAVLASLDNSTARTTNTVSDITTVKQHATFSNAIHVRSRHAGGVVGTECLLAVVISKNEDNVGTGILRHGGNQGQRRNQKRGG